MSRTRSRTRRTRTRSILSPRTPRASLVGRGLGLGALALVVALSAIACGGKQPPKEPQVTETVSDAGAEEATTEPAAPKSLFERLGGKDGIAKIVDSFFKNLASNDATKKRIAKLPKDNKVTEDTVALLCKESGGDCEYAGKDVKSAFKGMKVTENEWNAAVTAFKAALDENNVAEGEQGDFIALLAPMKDDIVEVKSKPKK